MTHRSILSCLFLVAVTAIGVFGLAQDSPTEAPAGFDTPTLVQNPGSQSKSNGVTEPAGDTYALEQQIYETTHDATTGLAPFTTPGPAPSVIESGQRRGQPIHRTACRPSGRQWQFRESHGTD